MPVKALIFWIIFCAAHFPGFCQENTALLHQLQFADSLLSSGNPYDAVTEYERVLFFDTRRQFTFRVLAGKASAYHQGGKYQEAAECAELAIDAAPGISKIREMQFFLIQNRLLQHNTAAVYGLLDAMRQNKANDTIAAALQYWYGWAKMFDDDWEQAANYFGECDSADFLKNFCLDVHNKKYPVSFIKFISLVLPGSGSLYTGHYLSGALSLGWNVLFGYLSVHAFQEQRILDGFLIADLLWLRFYTGSLENAEKYAIEANKKIYIESLQFLETEYQGAKP